MNYHTALTREMDKYLLGDLKESNLRTYICPWDEKTANEWAIRFLGATRGYIKIDDGYKIVTIGFDEDTCFGSGIGCYSDELRGILEKFINSDLELEEGLVKVEVELEPALIKHITIQCPFCREQCGKDSLLNAASALLYENQIKVCKYECPKCGKEFGGIDSRNFFSIKHTNGCSKAQNKAEEMTEMKNTKREVLLVCITEAGKKSAVQAVLNLDTGELSEVSDNIKDLMPKARRCYVNIDGGVYDVYSDQVGYELWADLNGLNYK